MFRILVILSSMSWNTGVYGQTGSSARYTFNFHDTLIQTGAGLVLPGFDEGVPYHEAKYLVIDLQHHNPASSILLIGFGRQGDHRNSAGRLPSRLNCRIGVLPGLRTRVIFPLDYLDAQEIFLPRYPRQLKGTLGGQRIEAEEIDEVYISLQEHQGFKYPESVEIFSLYLADDLPDPLPAPEKSWVDSMGQWALKEWPGKLENTRQLQPAFSESLQNFGMTDIPSDRSMFMGFKDRRFDSTGFFHTHFDGRRWWLADPEGYAYLSIAPTGVGMVSSGPVENNPEIFDYLPDQERFAPAYSENRGLQSVSFLTVNLMRMFGNQWESEWVQRTRELLVGMGFSGSGNWSDKKFHAVGQLPYVFPMWGFPSTKVKVFRDFPDVFDPAYLTACEAFAAQLIVKKNDPWMIGYFLGNEPHWAFGDFNLAREMLYKNQQSYTRQQLISWLENKYHSDPYAFSSAWEIEFTSFSELNSFVLPHEKFMSKAAERDLQEFTRIMIDQYIRTICDETRKADPNHLNLGLRFAWISSDACIQTGSYFDVFSLNGYSYPNPPETERIAQELKMPVLIGEFHFGSTDRGLPATGIKGVASQRDRGIAYRHYVENGFARKEIIGIHYFQWNDQPVTGRFDGENYNIGVMDVTYRPYPEMARAIRKTNYRLFDIAAGKRRPIWFKGKPMPAIYY